jgi:hypothetical protein
MQIKKGKRFTIFSPPTIKHKDSFYFLATESFVATTAESFEMVSFTATLSFAAVESLKQPTIVQSKDHVSPAGKLALFDLKQIDGIAQIYSLTQFSLTKSFFSHIL